MYKLYNSVEIAIKNGDYEVSFEVVCQRNKLLECRKEITIEYYQIKTREHPNAWFGHLNYSIDIGDMVYVLSIKGKPFRVLMNEEKYRYRYTKGEKLIKDCDSVLLSNKIK